MTYCAKRDALSNDHILDIPACRYHREYPLVSGQRAVYPYRPLLLESFLENLFEFLRVGSGKALRTESFRQFREVGFSLRCRSGISLSVEGCLPLLDHTQDLVVHDYGYDRKLLAYSRACFVEIHVE